MSKRASSKRKASEALGEEATTTNVAAPSVAAALKKPGSLAKTLLGWLPQDATLENKDAKNLLKAFDLVKSELQHRTNLMVASCVETGAKRDVLLSGVGVPHEVFLHVLNFLPRHEAVHKVSLVSKACLAVARAPQFWKTLSNEYGLLEKSTTVTNMTKLLELLNRPQFASLKTLVPPDKVQLRKKALEQIAKACPLLEEIDLGYSLWSNMKPDDAALLSLPSLFPHLTKVRLNNYKVTNAGMASFCERMGDRLLSFRIREEIYRHAEKLSIDTLKVMSQCCSMLECFNYEAWSNNTTRLTEQGVIDLLKGCPNLKTLVLMYAERIDFAAIEQVLSEQHDDDSHVAKLNRLFVVNNSQTQLDNALCARISEKVDSFETITRQEHSERINTRRISRHSHLYWCTD